MADLPTMTVTVVMRVSVSMCMLISNFLNVDVVVTVVARVVGGGGFEIETEIVQDEVAFFVAVLIPHRLQYVDFALRRDASEELQPVLRQLDFL